MTDAKHALWDHFCAAHGVAAAAVPLFETHEGIVVTRPYGRDNRLLLQRSPQMEALTIAATTTLLRDHAAATDTHHGLIYMMLWRDGDRVLPLYIGKAEKFGRGARNLSANLAGIVGNKSKFARWGSNYAYHIGDLSAVACPGHLPSAQSDKYRAWAARLFLEYPSAAPRLRRETFFWAKAWGNDEIGIWREYGPTSLTFLEYLLIGVASDLFPESLLNREGVNRR